LVLTPGTRLGVYEVTAQIGEGGMGQVYRATDTKLKRQVAIKILPPSLAADHDRLARFQREAEVLASLNHPNIAAIYGLDESGGMSALVMELVEGDDLSQRIARGAVPLDEALPITKQIAEALDAAHEKGIVHRDLKPANIKITPDGVVKVLDFGLAKAVSGSAATADLTQSPTIMVSGTREGVILGTAPYMSPEQARGQTVDKRTDIWAFGCVLYEMLTGRPAFARETITDTLAAILEREPDWLLLPTSTPANIRRLLRRCLEKDLKRRCRDIGDARADLVDLDATLTAEVALRPKISQGGARAQRRWRVLALVAGAITVAALGALVLTAGRWSLVRPPVATPSDVHLQRITDFVGTEEYPAASPDGKTVAFIAPANGRRQVWLRLLAGGAPLQLTRDDADHEHPRWAPDSSSLIYFSGAVKEGDPGTLWEVSALGGTPRRIASSLGEGDISHDGRRIVTFRKQDNRTVLAILERDGSTAQQVKPLPPLAEFGSPHWSPDDRWIAFVGAVEIAFNRAVYVIGVGDGDPKTVATAQNIQGVAWLPDSSGLVYASSAGSTMAYPPIFNLRTVSREGGGPERQLTFGDVSYVQPDIVAAGKLFASRVRMQSDIWRFPLIGSPVDNVKNGTRITRQTGQVQTPSASPDGKDVAYLSDSGGHVNVWVATLESSGSRQITFERDPAIVIGIPVWAPAGDRIVMIQSRSGSNSEWLINPDGSGLREVVPRGAGAAWSPDGKWLYYFISPTDSSATTCIEKIPVDGGSAIRVRCDAANMAVASDGSIYYARSVSTPGEIWKAQPENGPTRPFAYIAPSRIPLVPQGYALSPDDRWLMMPLTDAGTTNIWLFPTDGGPARQLTDFGQRPILIARQVSWSPDGKFVYAAVVETDADIVLLDGMLR